MAPQEKDTTCRLRRFRPGDLPGMLRLDQHCFPPSIAFDRFEMYYYVRSRRHITLLAIPLAAGSPSLLGFIIAEAGRAGRDGQIVTLDVEPGCRRQGIGRLLMDAAEQRLASCGNPAVRLQVAEDNTGAREFYRGLGYRQAGRRPGYYPDGTDAVEMVKRLKS